MAVERTIHDLHFPDAPSMRTGLPGPESRKLLDRQARVESNAVAYPKDIPVALAEGQGATVKDVDGNVFLDFFAGIGVLNVGHANPYVLEAVHGQLDRLVHSIDFPTEPRVELVEKLNEIAPGALGGANRVVFGGPTGSDAIEATIKLAKYNTGGDGLIAFTGSYHGDTAGALTLTASKKYKRDYAPLLADVTHLPYPYPYRQGITEEAAVERALDAVRGAIEDPYGGLANPAGIWVEAIQGEGGIVVPPADFLPGLREIADEHALPLILDEIQTGFGRTGRWFACEWDGVTPDVMTMAKAIGGTGLPLSATMFHEDLDSWGPGGHVGTFRGNVPAMIGGLRAIEYIEAHDLLDHSREVGGYMRDRLRELLDTVDPLGDVRGRGLFTGAEFVDADGDPDGDVVDAIQTACAERGVLVWTAGRDGSVLRILPPLVLTHEQAEAGMDVVCSAIEELAG